MSKRKQVPWAVCKARAIAEMENREEPDFAPDPEDQETLDEIQDEIAKRAMEAWEDGGEPELDGFGNPVPTKAEGKQAPWAVRRTWAIAALEDEVARQSNNKHS